MTNLRCQLYWRRWGLDYWKHPQKINETRYIANYAVIGPLQLRWYSNG